MRRCATLLRSTLTFAAFALLAYVARRLLADNGVVFTDLQFGFLFAIAALYVFLRRRSDHSFR